MKRGRNRIHPPPGPGGEDDQIGDAGPVTHVYPMPPAKSFGKLIPCDDEMEVEVVTPTASPTTAAVRITVTRQPAAPVDQSSGNAATLAALEILLRQYAAAGYQIKFELTADARS